MTIGIVTYKAFLTRQCLRNEAHEILVMIFMTINDTSLMFTQPGPLVHESKHFIFTQPAQQTLYFHPARSTTTRASSPSCTCSPSSSSSMSSAVSNLDLCLCLCIFIWFPVFFYRDQYWHILSTADLLHESTCCRGPPEPATYFQVKLVTICICICICVCICKEFSLQPGSKCQLLI